MKFMNMRSTLISAVMASLIIIGGIFSLVGCNNGSSSTAGGNISGDISDSSQAGGEEPSGDNGSDVAKDLFNYKDIEFSLCDYSISFPRNWRVDSASGGMEVCGNMDMEQKQRDYFLVNADAAIDSIFSEFEELIQRTISSIGNAVTDILQDSGNKLKEEISSLSKKGEDLAKEKMNDLIDTYAGKMAGSLGGAAGGNIQTSASSGITLNYEEYLKIIVLMNCISNDNDKEMVMLTRAAKLIQLNLSKGNLSKDSSFDITKKYTMVEINSTASIRTTFLNIPVPNGKIDSDGREVYEFDYSRIGSNRRKIDYVGVNGY